MKKEKRVKLPAGIDETFVSEIESLSSEDLKGRIVQLQAAKEDNDAFKLTEGYVQAKDDWEMVSGPVRDTNRAIKNKTKMIIELLKQKGAL